MSKWQPTHIMITPDGYAFLMPGERDADGLTPMLTEHGSQLGRTKLEQAPWVYAYVPEPHKPCVMLRLDKIAEVGLSIVSKSTQWRSGIPSEPGTYWMTQTRAKVGSLTDPILVRIKKRQDGNLWLWTEAMQPDTATPLTELPGIVRLWARIADPIVPKVKMTAEGVLSTIEE